MKGKGGHYLETESTKLVWLGFTFGILFWLLEAATHAFVFYDDSFGRAVFSPDPHETWMRLIIAGLFIAFGIYAQVIVTQRKRAEGATRLAHAEIDQIFQTAADAMRVIDKDFNVLRVNETFVNLSGVGKSEAIGRKCYEVFRGPRCHTAGCPLTTILGGADRVEYDTEKECSDGKRIPCIVTATPFRGPAGGLIGIVEDFKDIRERQKAEQAREDSEKRLKTILDSIQAGVVLIDAERHVIVDANPAASELIGAPREKIVGHVCHDFICPAETGRCPITDLGKTMDKSERVLVKGDGQRIPILKTVTPINLGGRTYLIDSFVDITERKQAEESLRRSEERYRTLFESSRDAIYITSRGGEFIDVNQTFLDLFGYTKEQMLRLNAVDIYVRPDDRGRFLEAIEEIGSVRDFEVRLLKKNGKEMDCLLTAAVRRDEDGNIRQYQGIIRDITERKRLEAQVLQATKLEAIGTLAGGIAHDFNNLLMGIRGNVSLMLLDKKPTDPDYGRIMNIDKQVQSAARLTSHLLGYARKGKYEIQPININQLVKETSDTFSRTKNEITVHTELAGDLLSIEADPGQIEQVLWNLYINAADAMSGGGQLTVKTANTTHQRMQGKVYKPKPGDYVLLTVTDTGVGMDKRTLERIYDPFFTTKEMDRGTGLGLASAYGIIKSHSGYIDVRSAPGKGSTFSIYLPASQRRVRKSSTRNGVLVKGTETVLLVDDEEGIRQVGEDLLRAMGYRALVASNGKEAIELYTKNRKEVAIVLLDMVMPEMSGSETYDRLKEVDPKIKVILFSGYSIDGEASEILRRGCNGFIQKPFSIKNLSGKIREILDQG